MVEYIDGSVIAQLGVADMGIPILYALTYPERRPGPAERLDLVKVGRLTFHEPDYQKFPCLALARAALARGGSASVVLNAANEVAVAAFLDGRLRFIDIAPLIERTLERVSLAGPGSIEECVEIDGGARRVATELLARHAGGRA
jgi:1-deoxy-D-xylulose-5-phosphate reductoisomerase